MGEKSVIRFQAQVAQVKTSIDGGYSLLLSLSEKDLKAATKLMECRKIGVVLEVAAVPIKITLQPEKNAEKPTRRRKRYPYKPDA